MIAFARIVLVLLADVVGLVRLAIRARQAIAAEKLVLRRQLSLYKEREVKPRGIDAATRVSLAWLSSWCEWRSCVVVVRPETVIRWHRAGWRRLWAIKSRLGRPRIPLELLIDRDTKYGGEFRRMIADAGNQVIRLPPRSPNLNADAEQFVGSIKSECLNRLIFVGKASLRRALREFAEHDHRECNHQGLENRVVAANDESLQASGAIACRARLGGILNFYFREAA